MNSANNSQVSKDSFDTTNISVKLRRLKIEENVIFRSIQKTSQDFQDDNVCCHGFYSQSNLFFRNLRDSVTEIKKLFVDIKFHINSQSNMDIVGELYLNMTC